MSDFATSPDVKTLLLQHKSNDNPSCQAFREGSMFAITNEFDKECRVNGAKQAIEQIYKNLYARYYRNRPTGPMLRIEGVVDEDDAYQRQSYCFVTIRCHPDSVPESERYDYTQWCQGIPHMFSFLSSESSANKFCWETVNSIDRTLHFHGVFKMDKGYSPAQMRNQMTNRSVARKWFQPHPTVAVFVRRIRQKDLKTVQEYIAKGGESDLPPQFAKTK